MIPTAMLLVGCTVAVLVIVVLALHYHAEAQQLPEYRDHTSIGRQRDTLDRLGCAAGHHRLAPVSQPLTGARCSATWRCTVCRQGFEVFPDDLDGAA